jgi:hypothetical protein
LNIQNATEECICAFIFQFLGSIVPAVSPAKGYKPIPQPDLMVEVKKTAQAESSGFIIQDGP